MSYHDSKIKLLFLNDVLLGHIGRCEGVDYASDIDFRRMKSDQLTKSERAELLRCHPMIAARIHYLSQEAFWKHILNGRDRPFGHILDFWRRVEFQARGSPHSHNLLCIKRYNTGLKENELSEFREKTNPDEYLRSLMLEIENKYALRRGNIASSESANDIMKTTYSPETKASMDKIRENISETLEHNFLLRDSLEKSVNKYNRKLDEVTLSKYMKDVYMVREHDIMKDTVTSKNPFLRQLATNEMSRIATAALEDRHPLDFSDIGESRELWNKEKDANFNVNRKTYFKDASHPCRMRMTSGDYSYRATTSDESNGSDIQIACRRLKLANQMHVCVDSCYKFCKKNKKLCRYGFTRTILLSNDKFAIIHEDRDHQGRVRVTIHPIRNNVNLNNTCRSPVIQMALRSNHDIKYLSSTHGAVEYVCKYCAKVEAPDSKQMIRAVSSRLRSIEQRQSFPVTITQRLSTAANAVVSSRQIGAIEACYIIADMDLVQSSRTVINVNTLPITCQTTAPVITNRLELQNIQNEDSVIREGLSNNGLHRHAYAKLHQHQRSLSPDNNSSPLFTFYEFMSTFRVTSDTGKLKKPKKVYPFVIDSNGFIINAETFVFERMKYTALRKRPVLNICPYIPIDMKKPSSAYSILLLYSDWGSKGEVGILNDMPDPQSRLQEIFSTLPDYVQKSIKVIQSSEERLADTGNPDEQPTGNIDADEAQREFTEHLHDFDGISMEDINNPYRNVEQKPLGDQIIKPVTYNCSHSTMSYLYNFVDSLKSDWKNTPALDHCLTETEIAAGVRVAVSDHEAKEELLHTKYLSRFSALQMKAFSTFRDAVANVSSEQVVMVLSGEGGTGKSDVINAISIQTSLIVGKVNGRRGACIRMAPTGSAAFNIHGSTWQSCLEKGRDGYQSIKDVNINHQLSLERAFGGTIVVIIDEISMLSAENLIEISERYVII